MKLQRLRALRAVMRTRSVTGAAAELNLTQPAVSRLISGLEEDVGFALFAREGGRLLPTSEGELFFARAEHALAGVDDLSRFAREIGSHREGSMLLLCTPQAGYTIFPEAVGRFAGRYPNIHVGLHIVQRREVAQAARTTPYDMGFTVVPFGNLALPVRGTFTLAARALVPAGHRLARRRSIVIRDFAGENLVMLTRDNSIRPRLELELARSGIAYRSTMETTSPIVACKLVAQGIGLAVVDPFSARLTRGDGVVTRPLAVPIELTYGFFFPENRPVSRPCEDFIEILLEVAKA